MKNISKTIAAFSLSLLTVGAMAQTTMPTPMAKQSHMVVKTGHSAANQHRASSVITSGLIDYVDGDATNNSYTFWNGSSGDYTLWSPILYMNAKYTLADTVYSPLTSNAANQYTATGCTVVFDTMWDNYQGSFFSVGRGSAVVDTIWTQLGYHNTSGQNDTLVLTVCAVNAAGYYNPATVYGTLTEIIVPHSATLPGTSLDSSFFVGWVPSTPIAIPTTAPAGWHFCVHATVLGSKLDTLGPTYYSAFTQCGGSAYSDSSSSMGPLNGTAPTGTKIHSNSYVNGLFWFNAPKPFSGPGGATSFPVTGTGLWSNGTTGFFYFQPCAGTPPYLWYPYIQNIAIFASVNYVDATGINNIAASGLSVGQNYPNPFNKETTISYSLTKSSDVTFTVYDMTGRVITTNSYGSVAPGQYNINLSANTFKPGIYFYTFNVNGSTVTKKMVITE
jgi:hypothetical protein